jgi:GT2 family glycosyltransferase
MTMPSQLTTPIPVVNIEISEAPSVAPLPEGAPGAAVIARWHGRIGGMLLSLSGGGVRVDDLKTLFDAPPPAARPLLGPMPSLTVAVCTRNRPVELRRSLASIVEVCREAVGNVELLVVDNAPENDLTEETVREFPGVRYTVEPRPGLSFARNCATEQSSSEYIAYIDDDAVLDREWLAGFQEAHSENPDAAAFSGPILPLELATEAQLLLEARTGIRRVFRKTRYTSAPISPHYPCGEACLGTGGNMVVRRDVLLALGGFDEALGCGMPSQSCEDLDLFYRLIRAGYVSVHEPQMAIFHQNKREMERLRRQVDGWAVGMVAHMLKAFAADPSHRSKIAGFLCRLGIRKLGGIAASLFGVRSYRWPVDLALAEFFGYAKGFLGVYQTSVRAAKERRRANLVPSRRHETAAML